jgi:DNA polymerase-3 subunit epsilon
MELPVTHQSAIQTLFESANVDQFKVYALGSPFETKEILKQRTYRWSPDIKCWSKVLSSREKLNDELVWLKQNVYGARKGAKVEIETFSAFERHAEREGFKSLKDLSEVGL